MKPINPVPHIPDEVMKATDESLEALTRLARIARDNTETLMDMSHPEQYPNGKVLLKRWDEEQIRQAFESAVKDYPYGGDLNADLLINRLYTLYGDSI